MSQSESFQAQAKAREYNLLRQEVRETRERTRLGGFFYPIATALAFMVTSAEYLWQGIAITVFFLMLAAARMLIRMPETLTYGGLSRHREIIWFLILLTTFCWGIFSAWSFVSLPEPAPLVSVLFCGAFGMALAHSMCMRRVPCSIAIISIMLPSQLLLWHYVAPGVAVMWAVYMTYMLLVMMRSYREYRTRLELEADLREQRDLFEKQSLVDGLTGIANRRGFADALAAVVSAEGSGLRAALLILDIDHFKRINDSLGHQAGDACLVAMAERLRQHFDAPGDFVARLGGEEFGVILAGNGDAAYERAEGFRRELESASLGVDGAQARMTVSIGCGSFDPSQHTDTDALYRDVDSALYRSKQSGRNRTERTDRAHNNPAGVKPAGPDAT